MHNAYKPVVVNNFLCQGDWATRYQPLWYSDIRLNVILGVSVRIFLDKVNI